MKETNQGFTLVELLAVIIILAIIATITTVSVINTSNHTKERMFCTKVQTIEHTATLWGADNIEKLFTVDAGQSYKNVPDAQSFNVQILIDDNYVKQDDMTNNKIIDPRNKQSMNELPIKIYIKNNRVYAKIIELETLSLCGSNVS